MAWALLQRALVPWRGLFELDSGGIGTHAREGGLMSLDARLSLKAAGIELDENAFRSKDLRRHPEAVAGAGLVIAMTQEQCSLLLDAFPELNPGIVHTWLALADESGDIEDPCGKGPEGAGACLRELERTLPSVVKNLLGLALKPFTP
jgi:protein-tyrosine-phosphatase